MSKFEGREKRERVRMDIEWIKFKVIIARKSVS